MKKILNSNVLKIILLTIVLLIISSVIPRHLGRLFTCYEYRGQTNVKVKREQYGFPFVLAKRSMSSTSCDSYSIGYGDKGPDIVPSYVFLNPDEHHEILDSSYFIIVNMLGDAAVWLIVSYSFIKVIKKKNAR
jgi:hypothetical protein